MNTATTHLLDLVRQANGNCTDYRAGKLLESSTSTVSKWRVGRGHMSMANIQRACELAGISDQAWEWQIRIGAERELGPDGDVYRAARKDLEALQAGGEPSPSGLFAWAARRASHAAAIVATLIVLVFGALLPDRSAEAASTATAVSAEMPSRTHTLGIMVSGLIKALRHWRDRICALCFPMTLQGMAA